MSIKPITTRPEKILSEPAKPVGKNENLAHLIEDMVDSMRSAQGIGIAAPQIGKPLRLFVINPELFEERPAHTVFVNPVLKKTSFKRVAIEEGCLSVPRIFGAVKRPARVTVEAYDEHWKKFKVSGDGMLARVFQHELDHLEGILFVEKADPETLHEYIPEDKNSNS